MNAFHVPVPDGATSLDVRFQYLSPPTEREGRVEMTPDMVDLAWNTVVLYPAGVFSRGITVQPSLALPKTWQTATALERADGWDGAVSFKPTTLNTLVDSPLYAGRVFFQDRPGAGRHRAGAYERFCRSAAGPGHHPGPARKTPRPGDPGRKTLRRPALRALRFPVRAQRPAWRCRPGTPPIERRRVGRNYFTNWDHTEADRDLLPHEYTHSWNGKFRRPADLWAPNFNVPERDSLLWVYEGQTQFWGQVLAARSGLWSHQEALDAIADDAASMQAEIGRAWRPLQDTTNDPVINARRPQSWHSWERQEDYYVEGLLIWLDADTLIREQTHGSKSLGDFAHAFFGIEDGSFVTHPYVFGDVVAALNAVMPHDWAGFLRARLDVRGGTAPLDGLTRGGYRLIYTDTPSATLKSEEDRRKTHDYTWSVGADAARGRGDRQRGVEQPGVPRRAGEGRQAGRHQWPVIRGPRRADRRDQAGGHVERPDRVAGAGRPAVPHPAHRLS